MTITLTDSHLMTLGLLAARFRTDDPAVSIHELTERLARGKSWAASEGWAYDIGQYLRMTGLLKHSWAKNATHYTITDAGLERIAGHQHWFSTIGHCDACVRLDCVCTVRIGCIGDGPHSLGCHGSHD
jgi:hypothetical protein